MLFDPASCIIKPEAPAIILPKRTEGTPESTQVVKAGSLVVPKGRDSGVQMMVDALNHHAKKFIDLGDWDHMSGEDRFTSLGSAERQAILEQVRYCREDFIYALRNYFWLSNERGEDQLFTLWEPQWLVIQKWDELKRKGRAQKLMILKSRQLGALHPDTRVLNADMRWVSIGSLNPGDELVTVDEFSSGGKGHERKFRKGRVLNKWTVKKEAFKIRFTDGREIIASGDHPFLCRARGSEWSIWVTVQKQGTKKSRSPIRPGDFIRSVVKPWELVREFEDGWMAGMLDGEGCLQHKKNCGVEITVAQVAGPVLGRAIEYMRSRGYNYRIEVDNRKKGTSSKLGDQPVYKVALNRIPEVMRLLGITRPSRFAGRFPWEGKTLPCGRDENWAEVASVESIGEVDLVDIETTEKTFIAEGLVTHNCSLLIEAMIAWRTMFFRNTAALVVASDEEQSSYLYGLMLHFYDKMPWWLKPEAATLEVKNGLHFDRKDRALREHNPGMNSRIYVQHANQMSGVGEGKRISSCHCSEYSGWMQARAKSIIEGDLLHSIHDDDPNAFGFLESTGRGAGTYSHMLWKANIKLGENAEWYPLFLPFFLDKTKSRPVPRNWQIEKPERLLRDRVHSEWVSCTFCGQHQIAKFGGRSRVDDTCPACDKGVLKSARIADGKLYWKELKRKNAEAKDKEAMKHHLQEVAATAEDAWQLSGYAVFDEQCQDAMAMTVRDPIKCPDVRVGFIDSRGRFHGPKFERTKDGAKEFKIGCFVDGCTADHRTAQLFEDESTFIQWEQPKQGYSYAVGVDIAEGIGEDYSVIAVNKLGKGGEPDEQVAMWRSNNVEPLDLALFANVIGRWYNEALMCIEYNFYKSVADEVRCRYQYPNLFRWKHLDHVDVTSRTFHWITQSNTKPKLWQTARKWIKVGAYVVRDPTFVEESQVFQKDDEDDKRAEASKGSHDDVLIAFMIALYCSHEFEADDTGRISVPNQVEEKEPARYKMTCQSCGAEWGAANPESEYRCIEENCGSIRLLGTLLEMPDSRAKTDPLWDQLLGHKQDDGAGRPMPPFDGYDPRVLGSNFIRPKGPNDPASREDYWGK